MKKTGSLKKNGAILEFKQRGDLGSWQYLKNGIFNEIETIIVVVRNDKKIKLNIRLNNVLSHETFFKNEVVSSLIDNERTLIYKEAISMAFDSLSENLWIIEGEILQDGKKNIPILIIRNFELEWSCYSIIPKESQRHKILSN